MVMKASMMIKIRTVFRTVYEYLGALERADRYALKLPRAVKGWLHPIDAQLIRLIGRIQERYGFTGSLGEIGVHHGKLFILLQLMANTGIATS